MLEFHLLTCQHWWMLLFKATPICFQSEVSGAAGICREEPSMGAAPPCKAAQATCAAIWEPINCTARGKTSSSGTSPGRALPAPGRGTGLQPLTSFQQDRAQTSVPSRDCARPPRRTDTLCNAETDFTEELGIAANQCSTPRIWPSVCRNNKGLAMKPAHVCSKSCLIICLLAKTF